MKIVQGLKGSIAFRAQKYGYANARVKALKQSLLSAREVYALIEAKNAGEVYALLERTPYKQDLVGSALKGKTLEDQIELACTKNFSRMLKQIVKISPKDLRPDIMQLFEKYEVNNVKLLILGKHLGQGIEETEQLVLETGILSRAVIRRALEAKTVKEAVSELGGTVYGAVLQKGLRKYEKENDVSALLFALDDYYFRKLPEFAKNSFRDERIILEMLKAQIDAKNISAILRAKNAGIEEAKISALVLGRGSLSREKIEKAVKGKNAEEAAKVFEKEFGLSKAIESFTKTGSLIPIEVELEKGVARKGLKVLSRSVLSKGAIAGLLFLKEEEVNNIRKIVRAKEFSLDAAKMREMIVETW